MNKKFLIVLIVVLGLGIGFLWSMLSTDSYSHHDLGDLDSLYMTMDPINSGQGIDMDSHQSMTHLEKDVSDQFRVILDDVLKGYFSLQKALSKDDLSRAKKAASLMSSTINASVELDGQVKKLWETEKSKIQQTLKAIENSKTLKGPRAAFEPLSASIEMLVVYFGSPKNFHITKYHCPMVDGNRGAFWLQNTEGTQNPYYGSEMFGCGSKVKEL